MLVARYFVLFIVFSVIGWLFECVYCTIREHHWQNRGFLFGPLCPIYGTGAVLAMAVFSALPAGSDGTHPLWQIFLICAAGSAVLEFVTSWLLEKWFHAVWWDYSNMPLNLQGRICLPATCGFGIAGVVIVKWILPFIEQHPMGGTPLLNEVLSIALSLMLGMDLALTVESLMRLTHRMEEAEERFNSRMEERVQTIREGPAAVGSAVRTSAADAGETAAIAAMLAADAARERMDSTKEKLGVRREADRRRIADEEWQESLQRLTGDLSGRDRYHLRSIRAYRPRHPERPEVSEKLRGFFAEMQKKAGSPFDRQVKKK